MIKKGVLLLGGTGSRLFPLTKSVNKHLLPIYNKPMFFYPLSILMLMGIREIYLIVDKENKKKFYNILKDGTDIGLKIHYLIQEKPDGIAGVFKILEPELKNDSFALILGDNFFYSGFFSKILEKAVKSKQGSTIFLYPTNKPQNFGVAKLKGKKIIQLVEKPKKFVSNFAITGLYIFDKKVFKFSKKIKKSDRGEFEMIDILNKYKKIRELKFISLGRGSAWLDVGSFEELLSCNNFVNNIQSRQNFEIGCLEEIALNKKWVSKNNLKKRISLFKNSEYAKYIKNI